MKLPPDLHTPAIDALRASLDQDADTLIALMRSADPAVQAAAIRAVGRYESREFTAALAPYLTAGPTAAAATALARSLAGAPLALDTSGEQVQRVLEALIQAGEAALYKAGPLRYVGIDAIARAIGALPYVRAEQVQAAEAFLLLALRRVDDDFTAVVHSAEITRGIESLVRRNARLASLSPEAAVWMRRIVAFTSKYPASARVNAMATVVAAGAADAETIRAAATSDDPELRRAGVLALAAANSPVNGAERARLLSTLLSDSAIIVRVEAVRAWARTESGTSGCGRLLDATRTADVPVVLQAIDALGDACKDDQNVTDWLTADLRTPPHTEWHRASHALVAMARRAPDRAAIAMPAHVSHEVWQVRMYAARAAALMNDVVSLEKLGYDAEPNVREATLAPLRKVKGDDAIPFFESALAQRNYQLVRTAAEQLKGIKPTASIVAALCDALKRITLERRETSRDTRLALLSRLDELGSADQADALAPLLQDFDIPVATAAQSILQRWTGKPQDIAPQLLPRPAAPRPDEIDQARTEVARVEFKSGKVLQIRLIPDVAPLMSTRFLRLAKSGYYNGLTIHRIVPNFVVQGGSPAANEYDGDALYVRDELGALANRRGTVGLSTRGRDTGDAQFYFNLVDNPRLDADYTVFGTVTPREVMDGILEGETIASITFSKPPAGTRR